MTRIRDPRYYDMGIPPARRMAVIAMEVLREAKAKQAKHPTLTPDYADFEEAFAPMLERELLSARLDQCTKDKAGITTAAMELQESLMKLAESLPPSVTAR